MLPNLTGNETDEDILEQLNKKEAPSVMVEFSEPWQFTKVEQVFAKLEMPDIKIRHAAEFGMPAFINGGPLDGEKNVCFVADPSNDDAPRFQFHYLGKVGEGNKHMNKNGGGLIINPIGDMNEGDHLWELWDHEDIDFEPIHGTSPLELMNAVAQQLSYETHQRTLLNIPIISSEDLSTI